MYAFHYAFAKEKGLKMVKTGETDLFDVFNVPKSAFLSEEEYSSSNCRCLTSLGDRYHCSYDEHVGAFPPGKSVNIYGYFQSWRYWVKYEEEIRKQFTFRRHIFDSASKNLHSLLSKTKWNFRKDLLVGVHIRRGDYASKKLIKFGQRTAPLEYILKAMEVMKSMYPRAYFLIFSDTIKWAKTHIPKVKNRIFVEGNTGDVDMAMLTLSNHSIITAGTYSWWVGFLTNGTTIYYKDIFTRNTGYSAQFRDESVADFFPTHWKGL